MDFGLTDFTLLQALEVAVVTFIASVIGGLAGYGTGLIMPLVLVPIIGAEATVPVIAVSAILTNLSRVFAFYKLIDWRAVLIATPLSLLSVWLSARFFTSLDQREATLAIGCVLLAVVPLRHVLKSINFKLGDKGLALGGGVYGLVTGTSTGAGVILISILMAAGLVGSAVVATDAAISVLIGVVKISTFHFYNALPENIIVLGVILGLCTMPGAYVAKLIANRLSAKNHTMLLDAAVLLGGIAMIARALG